MRREKGAIQGSSITSQKGKTSIEHSETNKTKNSGLHVNDSNSVEALIVGDNTPLNSSGLPSMKKKLKMENPIVRRSGRIKIASLLGRISVVKPAMEGVNIEKNDKEGAPRSQQVSSPSVVRGQEFEGGPQVQQDSTIPNKTGLLLEEKIDYLVQAVDEFKAQGFEKSPEESDEDHSPNFSYKTLYLDSQKKIEALIAENYELVKKLEYARGKVAAYEKLKDSSNASKEVLFVRATEAAALNLSPQMFHHFTAPNGGSDLPNGKVNSKKRKVTKL